MKWSEMIYSRICLIRRLKGIRKKWRIMQTGENSVIEACILYHSNSYTQCSYYSKIQVNDVMVEYN